MPQTIPETVLTPLDVRTPLAGAKLLWKPYTVSQEKKTHVFVHKMYIKKYHCMSVRGLCFQLKVLICSQFYL